jgi:hypothetical protein
VHVGVSNDAVIKLYSGSLEVLGYKQMLASFHEARA